jgi:hypothetical protein
LPRVRFYLALSLGFTFAGRTMAQVTPPPPAASAAAKEAEETAELDKALAVAAYGDASGGLTASASTNDAGPAGIVPFARGFNASLGTTSQHDSAGGWSSVITPTVAYRFNRHFSLLAGVPVYGYIGVYNVVGTIPPTKTTPAQDVYAFKTRNFLLGDTTVTGQYETHFRPFDYNLTAVLGAPTGDNANGLGAGSVTYSFNNHFERPVNERFTPELELGIGNSPNLDDSRVRKSYTDVGTNAHFQIGTNLQLPFNMSFTTDAFEELPLSTQTVTSTTTNGKKGKQLKTTTTTSNKSVGEDNGFLNTLDIPITPHITLSGFYNRSLRNKIDTAGFSITFLLKPAPRANEGVR